MDKTLIIIKRTIGIVLLLSLFALVFYLQFDKSGWLGIVFLVIGFVLVIPISWFFKWLILDDYKEPIKLQKDDVYLGETTHCVNCGKKCEYRQSIACGHVKTNKQEIIIARWCNGICLRDMHFKNPNWCGMQWIEEYGLEKTEDIIKERCK